MLASRSLSEDDPSFPERLGYVAGPLRNLAERSGVRVLGLGATYAFRVPGGLQEPSRAVPAFLVEWELPLVGRVAFEYGSRIEVDRIDEYRNDRQALDGAREMWDWLGGNGLEQGFDSARLAETDQVQVFALPPPLAYALPASAEPGDFAHCSGPSGPGTVGARVQVDGVQGFLTAGHVAPVGVGTDVYDQYSNLIGTITVRMCCNFDRKGRAVVPNSAVADVAVITASRPDRATSTASQGVARIRGIVTAYGAFTRGNRAELSTIGTPFAGPGAANWGEAMLTAYPISAPGDSGAQVLNDDGEVVGLVVGGFPGVYSVVQDIDYLLRAAGAVLR